MARGTKGTRAFSSTKRPRHQVLRGQLAEGDERPVPVPRIADPGAVEPAAVATEVGRRGVEVATGATPAAVVVGDARVVALRLPLLDPRRERARVAGEAPRLEVLAHLLGRDLPLRLPSHELEPLPTTVDRLAVEAPLPEVPAAVVAVEERQVAVLLGQCGQVGRVEVGHLDDVARVGHGGPAEGVTADLHRLHRLRLLRGVPVVDDDLDDGIHRVAPLGGHETVERRHRHFTALARLQELVAECPREAETLTQKAKILASHDRRCSVATAYPSSCAVVRGSRTCLVETWISSVKEHTRIAYFNIKVNPSRPRMANLSLFTFRWLFKLFW